MARPNKPWYRKSRKRWYVKINGVTHNLGPDKQEAMAKFHELMATPDKPFNSDMVVVVLDQFLQWNKANRKPRTHEWYMRHVEPFAKSVKDLAVSEIRTHHVQKHLDSLSSGDTSRNMAWRAISRAFNWAIRQELTDRNPALNAEKPAAKVREDYVTEAEYEIVMKNVKDQEFRDLLVVAWECGARPQELFTVTAQNAEIDKSRWHFPEGKRGRRRFVYLTEEAEEITRRRMEQYPEGPIFRNTRGRPWDKGSVKCRFARLASKVGRQLSLYLFRHAQITRQVVSGMDHHVIAHLSGHRDSKMIDRVYSHASEDWKFMRDKLRGTGTSA